MIYYEVFCRIMLFYQFVFKQNYVGIIYTCAHDQNHTLYYVLWTDQNYVQMVKKGYRRPLPDWFAISTKFLL